MASGPGSGTVPCGSAATVGLRSVTQGIVPAEGSGQAHNQEWEGKWAESRAGLSCLQIDISS